MGEIFVSYQSDFILAGITIVLFFILMAYRYRYMKPIRYKETPTKEPLINKEPISVILYVSSSAEILEKALTALLTQNYDKYEVIAINYGKNNDTEDVLKRLSLKYNHLYYTYIPQEARYLSKRKLAFTMGIKAAHYDRVLFIEPNCRPNSEEWLNEILKYKNDNSTILLGNAIYPFSKGLSQKIIAYEIMTDSLQYLSQAMSGSFIRGYGEYISYKKDLFMAKQGYKNHLNLRCGENDLFIHENATSKNTNVCLSQNSMTTYIEPFSRKEWIKKRFEKNTILHYYKGLGMFNANLEYLFYTLFILCVIACILKGVISHNWILALFGAVTFIELYSFKYILYKKAEAILNVTDIAKWLPILDIIRLYDFIKDKFILVFNRKKSYTCVIKD
ncbi:MAG: glycosyltransferase [Parabacteroides sp.]|nr:glycosyltransferase [Parabacteroides sp.]